MSASKKMMLLAFVSIGLGSLSAHAERGGISGGGGGVATPPGVAISKIRTAVEDSRIILDEWLRNQEALYYKEKQAGATQDSAIEKLIGSSTDVFDVMSDLTIEVRNNEPCLDKDGNPVDGSIVAHAPASICISAFRLKDKLNAYNYEYETGALVLHEISHLLGTDESEAVHVQTLALDAFVHLSAASERLRADQRANAGDDLLAKFREVQKKGSSANCKDLFDVSTGVLDFTLTDFNAYLSARMFRVKDSDHGAGVMTQFAALLTYVCGLDTVTVSPEQRQVFREKYERGFGDNDVVLADEYKRRVSGETSGNISHFPVYFHKIHKDSDREREWNEIISFYDQQLDGLKKLQSAKFVTIAE